MSPLDRLRGRLSDGDAEYLAHILSAAFYSIALIATVLLVIRRGPVRGIEAVA